MNIPPGCELPLRLPPPLVIGAKIYARVRTPKDGIYAGTIDAILPASYRVVFDKEEMIPPMIIKDSEVMSAQTVHIYIYLKTVSFSGKSYWYWDFIVFRCFSFFNFQ